MYCRLIVNPPHIPLTVPLFWGYHWVGETPGVPYSCSGENLAAVGYKVCPGGVFTQDKLGLWDR